MQIINKAVIPTKAKPTWQSPGIIYRTASQGQTLYRGIAAGLTALAMTEVVVTRLRRLHLPARTAQRSIQLLDNGHGVTFVVIADQLIAEFQALAATALGQ